VCQQARLQRRLVGQIDVDDLTPAGCPGGQPDLAQLEPKCPGYCPFDGRVGLPLDGSRAHPDVQFGLVARLDPVGVCAWVSNHGNAQHWPYHVTSTMPATSFQAPRGTQDILPEDAPYWAFVESEMYRQARLANYGEIRTPTFEETGVFLRGVGATTDIVEKEMYTFLDKGGDSMTLRPEGTAGIVRAYLQRGMASRPQPVKLFTELTTFRYDKPQKGRFREFRQIDFEAIGESDPLTDAELVSLQWRLYSALGLHGLSLQVNSIGDAVCRPTYIARLTEYFKQHLDGLCEECQRRLETNPLRLLDEKKPECQAVLEGAPHSADHLCDECRAHFETWLSYVEGAGIPFTINPRLVRGLDYYTRSVWEVWPPVVGSQSTIGGGGRYDGLAEQLGGRPTPAVGFATGVERIILELKDQQVAVSSSVGLSAFLVYQSEAGKQAAFRLAESLRSSDISTDVSFGDRKLGKQLAAADRAGARFALILGDDEIAAKSVTVKDLRNGGDQRRIAVADLVAVLRGERGTPD
jgi:histidyl-tRNA synthetase